MESTKTVKARLVDLSTTAAAALRRQRVLHATDRLADFKIWHGDPAQPIFTNEIGDRLTGQAATSAFARIARLAKVSSTRLQDCRHIADTLMVASGVDPVTVSSILGHDPPVLLRIYAHAVPTKKRAATAVVGEHIGRLSQSGLREPVTGSAQYQPTRHTANAPSKPSGNQTITIRLRQPLRV